MFDKIRKNFGFCCMRLPMQGKEVDYAEFNKLIDAFLDNSFNYFVPAHGYLDGHTICLCRGGERLFSEKKGIAPMMSFIGSGADLRGYSVADSGRISEIYDYYVKNAAITFGYVTCAPDEFMERMLNPATI